MTTPDTYALHIAQGHGRLNRALIEQRLIRG
jgi:hypothetical protein